MFQVDANVTALISGLTISGGGGLDNFGTLSMTNCTVSGNSVGGNGGGVYRTPLDQSQNDTLNMTNCTVSGNSARIAGGGMLSLGAATLTNTIVANSPSGGDVSNSGSLTLAGVNLVEDGSVTGSNVLNVDPQLGPLANNGGPTETMVLLPGAPAIDVGDNAAVANPPFPGPPFTDQRGFSRISGSTIDIGAFENQVPILSPSTLPTAVLNAPHFQTITATATGGASGPFSFAITTGELPAGLSLDPKMGTLSGTPTSVGTFNFTVMATDSDADTGSQGYSLVVNPASQTINLSPLAPITFAPNETVTLNATGGGSGNSVVFTIDASSTGEGSISGNMSRLATATI